jgi:hypothetical protein
MRYVILALLVQFVCAASAVQAQNLVTNPGFETGDFTGWTVTGTNFSVDSGVGHTGTFAASFGEVAPAVDDLSQTLATQSGQQYTLTFFAQTPEFNNPPGSPNALSVFFGGNLISGPFTVPDDPGYQKYSFTVTATSTTSLLHFAVSNDPDFTQLDDISVVAAVPEPGSLALLMGMTGAGFLMGRRRSHKAVRS